MFVHPRDPPSRVLFNDASESNLALASFIGLARGPDEAQPVQSVAEGFRAQHRLRYLRHFRCCHGRFLCRYWDRVRSNPGNTQDRHNRQVAPLRILRPLALTRSYERVGTRMFSNARMAPQFMVPSMAWLEKAIYRAVRVIGRHRMSSRRKARRNYSLRVDPLYKLRQNSATSEWASGKRARDLTLGEI
jgi:hypothetical protein